MAFGSWFGRYRYFLYAITFSLLATSFYRMYRGKGDVGKKTRIMVWCVAALSIGMTALSFIKNFRAGH